jgi:hypothetical protein
VACIGQIEMTTPVHRQALDLVVAESWQTS